MKFKKFKKLILNKVHMSGPYMPNDRKSFEFNVNDCIFSWSGLLGYTDNIVLYLTDSKKIDSYVYSLTKDKIVSEDLNFMEIFYNEKLPKEFEDFIILSGINFQNLLYIHGDDKVIFSTYGAFIGDERISPESYVHSADYNIKFDLKYLAEFVRVTNCEVLELSGKNKMARCLDNKVKGYISPYVYNK